MFWYILLTFIIGFLTSFIITFRYSSKIEKAFCTTVTCPVPTTSPAEVK